MCFENPPNSLLYNQGNCFILVPSSSYGFSINFKLLYSSVTDCIKSSTRSCTIPLLIVMMEARVLPLDISFCLDIICLFLCHITWGLWSPLSTKFCHQQKIFNFIAGQHTRCHLYTMQPNWMREDGIWLLNLTP